MAVSAILKGFDQSVGNVADRLERFLRRPGALPILIILLWACAVLPNLTVRSFIYEEGTNAEIARDVLANGHFLQPVVYGIRWHEKPSLLGWLIAGFAFLTGGVSEWSARLPAMVSVLVTALLVQRATRRYASLTASLFAALCFLFCPLLLQKLTIAEPDTLITALSFGAFVLWWEGETSGRVTILRWFGCGLLLAALAMAKGPQPTAFFALGVSAYLVDRAAVAGSAGLRPVHDNSGCGDHRVGRGRLSARRRSDMARVHATAGPPVILELRRTEYSQHRKSVFGVVACIADVAVCSLALATCPKRG